MPFSCPFSCTRVHETNATYDSDSNLWFVFTTGATQSATEGVALQHAGVLAAVPAAATHAFGPEPILQLSRCSEWLIEQRAFDQQ